MLCDNSSPFGEGLVDDIDLPEVNLSSLTNPKLSFWRAYSLYTDPSTSPNFSDTLDILISTDCGQSYQRIYHKFGTQLTTTASGFTPSFFIPAGNEWKKDSIDLSAYSQASNALFRIRNHSQYENALYLDDINIEGVTATKPQLSSGLIQISPNPSAGLFNIQMTGKPGEKTNLRVYDGLGNMLKEIVRGNSGLEEVIDLSEQPAGTYFLRIETEKGYFRDKLVLVR
jgi:hypothetical protein